MEAPQTIVKSALNPGNILKFAAGTFVFFAILDLAGITDYFLFPVRKLKAKFAKPSA